MGLPIAAARYLPLVISMLQSNDSARKALGSQDTAKLIAAVSNAANGAKVDLAPSFVARVRNALSPIIGERAAQFIFDLFSGKDAEQEDVKKLIALSGLSDSLSAEAVHGMVDETKVDTDGKVGGRPVEEVTLSAEMLFEMGRHVGIVKRIVGSDNALYSFLYLMRMADSDLFHAYMGMDAKRRAAFEGGR